MSKRSGFKANSVVRKLRRFFVNQSGQVALTAGLAAVPMFAIAAGGIEVARYNSDRAAFQNAIDVAALAIANDDRASTLDSTKIQENQIALEAVAESYIAKNMPNADDIKAHVTLTGSQVKLKVDHQFKTILGGMVGFQSVDMDSSTTVEKAMRPVELVMVMDTTGSMGKTDSSGKTFLAGAQSAANQLLKSLYGDVGTSKATESEYIRVALVPFAAAVRLDVSKDASGNYKTDFDLSWIDTKGTNALSLLNFTDKTKDATGAYVWSNYTAWSKLKNKSTNANMAWNGCVEARARGLASLKTDYIVNDEAPTSGDSLFPAYFNPDGPTVSNGTFYNDYVGNYSPATSTPPATGYETSGIGKSNDYTSSAYWGARFANQNKYNGFKLTAEAYDSSNKTLNSGPWMGCAVSPVAPMTYNRTTIETAISNMKAAGGTNIAEGLAWGWRVISPGAPFTKVTGVSGKIADNTIAPYNDARWQKYLVLMTDGENDSMYRDSNGNSFPDSYSKSGYNAYGRGTQDLTNNRYGSTTETGFKTAMDNNLDTLCSAIKNAGITIYTTAFNISSTNVETRLKNCASKPEYYAKSTTSANLATFFNGIGEQVRNSMIYVSN